METLNLFGWGAFGQLALAAILGGIIGAERELSGHPAGLRTNILVAVGSCLFTILSIHAFPLTGDDARRRADREAAGEYDPGADRAADE